MLSTESASMSNQQLEEERESVEWLRRFAEAGDRQALEDFFNCYQKRIYGFCRCLLGHAPGAEDATQATFIDVMRRAGEYASIRSIRYWLFGMARKACATQQRSEQRRARRERLARDERPLTNRQTPDAGLEHSESRELVLKALSQVSEQTRSAIFLRYTQNLSHREVAEALGLKETTVRSSVARGLQQLKLKLGQLGIASVPACLPGALDAEVPLTLRQSLLQATREPLNFEKSASGTLKGGGGALPSRTSSDSGSMRSWMGVAAFSVLALGVGAWSWHQMDAASRLKRADEVGSVAGAPRSSSRFGRASTPAEGFWNFTDQKLNGLKIVTGKWHWGQRRNNREDITLQFDRTPKDEKRFGYGCPILLTPVNLNLRPPVLVEFSSGTDYLEDVDLFTIFCGGFWSAQEAFPPSFKDLYDQKELFGSVADRLQVMTEETFIRNYKLYLTKDALVGFEDEKPRFRVRMHRPWKDAKDQLYLLWVFLKGDDGFLDNLRIKQLNVEELPPFVRSGLQP